MTQVKYSIITPCYNSFSLMNDYFASLEAQTYRNFEVIIVDDGSTDGTYEKLCEKRRQSALDIVALQSGKNAGPGNARNMGLAHARGEWVTFVDCDDHVSADFLEQINEVIETNDVGCVVFDYLTEKNGKTVRHTSFYGSFAAGIQPLDDCLPRVRNHAVGKVYKRRKLQDGNLTYPLVRRYEDIAFVVPAIVACGSVYYLKQPLYTYVLRENSLSRCTDLRSNDLEKACKTLLDRLANSYPTAVKEQLILTALYGSVLMLCKQGESGVRIRHCIDAYEAYDPDWYHREILQNVGTAKRVYFRAIKMRMIPVLKILTFLHRLMTA